MRAHRRPITLSRLSPENASRMLRCADLCLCYACYAFAHQFTCFRTPRWKREYTFGIFLGIELLTFFSTSPMQKIMHLCYWVSGCHFIFSGFICGLLLWISDSCKRTCFSPSPLKKGRTREKPSLHQSMLATTINICGRLDWHIALSTRVIGARSLPVSVSVF